MSDTKDPTKPLSNDEKFKPQNVEDAAAGGKGRAERNMKDTPRGSQGDIRRKSHGAR